MRREQFNYQFIFFLAICLSCVIAWLTPPFSIPDENAHYLRSYEVSHGHWINNTGNVGIPMPCTDYLKVVKQNDRVKVAFYQDIAEKMLPNAEECVVSSINTAGSYSPIPYLASAFGIRVAEELGYEVETRLKVGRIANSIITSLICFLAILAVHEYRLLLAAFVVLPMTMWLRASLSADAMTIAISIGYLAYILYLVEQKVPITRRIIILLSLLAILLGSIKPIYGLLSFSSLILFTRSCEWRINLINIMTLAIPGLFALIIGSMWVVVADPTTIYINTFQGANPTLQLHFLWNDPINVAHIISNTFKHNFFNFIGQATIPTLAFWPWIPPNVAISIGSFLCLCVIFTMVTTPTSLGAWQRVVLLGIALACLFAVLIPLYLTFTRVGNNEIIGLQGRYFLPLSFYAVIAGCSSMTWRFFANDLIRFIFAVGVPLIISVTLVIKYLG